MIYDGMIFYEPSKRDRSVLPHDPFKSLVAPRPIGWISTMDSRDRVNLAPYSFFNAVGERPHMLAFSSHGAKDSSTFAGEEIDTAGLRPIARCGGPADYTVVERIFRMTRPSS